MDAVQCDFARRQLRLTEALKRIDEVLDDLSLYFRYLEFDLEVTRRENRHLRRLVPRARS